MRASRYHALAKHSASHRVLLESLADFHKKTGQAEDCSAWSAESAVLERWLVPHTATDDQRFSEFLSAQEYLRRAPSA
jgi:hemerythrin